jgi:hypothetical protein
MTKNQLFKTTPTEELCLEVLEAFGLKSMDDTTNFSKKDLEIIGTVDKLYSLKQKLEIYYIPCKARLYLNDITSKNCITILRQILKVFERTVTSREKYIRGQKFVIYQIIPKEYKKYQPISINNVETAYLISFD